MNTTPLHVPLAAAAHRVPRFGDGRDWFFENRFGLFLHWGIYSIPCWHEQHAYRRHVPRREYEKLAKQFNPVHYDPDAWLDLAESVGMKYICLTTKHVDGFCMWETRQTNYNIMYTPYGRDVLKMLADACHRRGMPLCLYYSCADMHQPNYPNAGRAYELAAPDPGDEPDVAKYIAFVKAQVTELCTQYGEIHGFWWDANVLKHCDASVNQIIRKLQPKAIINNRGYDDGDFSTPERDFESVHDAGAFERATEACQAVGSQSWGYRTNETYYTDGHLLRSIDKYLARNANYLLNVGPKPDGRIGPDETAILHRIGKWYRAVSESFLNVEPCSALTANRDVLLTRRGNDLYVHLYKEPVTEGVSLKPICVAPARATLLNTGQSLPFEVSMYPSDHVEQKPFLHLNKLPVNERSNTVLVVKLEFTQSLDTISTQTQLADINDHRLR